jgi:hypothetical protein
MGGKTCNGSALAPPPSAFSPRNKQLWQREERHTDSGAEVWVPDNFAG